jgi:hypothetical protein
MVWVAAISAPLVWDLGLAPMLDRSVKYLRITIAGLLVAMLLGPAPASAHPHVWVTAKSEVVYAADSVVTGVRYAWTFDDMFSTFAVQGIEPKHKGVFSREDLAPLAQVNITSLKEFDYFTHAKADGKKLIFSDPIDYWLDYHDNVLTLHFTLPLKTPVSRFEFCRQGTGFACWCPGKLQDQRSTAGAGNLGAHAAARGIVL